MFLHMCCLLVAILCTVQSFLDGHASHAYALIPSDFLSCEPWNCTCMNSVGVLWGWKSLLWRGISYRCDWLSSVPRPRAGSVCAAWRECEGLGGGNGRLGWWGHTHHPPTKLPEEIPPEERIQTLCYLSILLGWKAGLGAHTLFSSQLFCGWIMTFQLL